MFKLAQSKRVWVRVCPVIKRHPSCPGWMPVLPPWAAGNGSGHPRPWTGISRLLIFLKCMSSSHFFPIFNVRSVLDLYLEVWYIFVTGNKPQELDFCLYHLANGKSSFILLKVVSNNVSTMLSDNLQYFIGSLSFNSLVKTRRDTSLLFPFYRCGDGN